jgi:hypothetical protein
MNLGAFFGADIRFTQVCFERNEHFLVALVLEFSGFEAFDNYVEDETSQICSGMDEEQGPGRLSVEQPGSMCFRGGEECLVDCLPNANDSPVCLADAEISSPMPSSSVTTSGPTDLPVSVPTDAPEQPSNPPALPPTGGTEPPSNPPVEPPTQGTEPPSNLPIPPTPSFQPLPTTPPQPIPTPTLVSRPTLPPLQPVPTRPPSQKYPTKPPSKPTGRYPTKSPVFNQPPAVYEPPKYNPPPQKCQGGYYKDGCQEDSNHFPTRVKSSKSSTYDGGYGDTSSKQPKYPINSNSKSTKKSKSSPGSYSQKYPSGSSYYGPSNHGIGYSDVQSRTISGTNSYGIGYTNTDMGEGFVQAPKTASGINHHGIGYTGSAVEQASIHTQKMANDNGEERSTSSEYYGIGHIEDEEDNEEVDED